MIKKLLIFAIIVLFIGMSVVSGFNIQLKNTTSPLITGRGKTLYVGGSGPGNYTKIQDAINDSIPGDTVFVYNDSSPYNEKVAISKMIKLIGEDRDTTIINGMNALETIFISPSVDNVLISGFTITESCYGISLNSDYNVIQGNKIVFNHYGIEIYCDADYNIINNNIIIHNFYGGIYDDGRDSGSTITWNLIADNGNPSAGHGGLYKHYSYGYHHHNDFYFNWGYNAYVSGPWGNTWDDGSEGNYWDDWKYNPGYPDVYIIPSSWEDEIDRYPSSTPYIDHPIVTIDYDYYGGVNELINFSAIYVDPSFVSWFWEFGDGATSNEICPKHAYSKPGTFHINLTVTNDQGISDTDKSTAYIGEPPNKPTISGPTTGERTVLYNYSIVATDPDDGNLYYYIDWGPWMSDEYIGPYPAGEVVNVSYRWYQIGTFIISVYAVDEAGFESEWATLEVNITKKSKDVNLNLLIFELLEKCPLVQKLLYLLDKF